MDIIDSTVVATIVGIISAFLTYLLGNKTANTEANKVSTSALTATIESLQLHIKHLDLRLIDLEEQLSAMSTENIALMREVHEFRKIISVT